MATSTFTRHLFLLLFMLIPGTHTGKHHDLRIEEFTKAEVAEVYSRNKRAQPSTNDFHDNRQVWNVNGRQVDTTFMSDLQTVLAEFLREVAAVMKTSPKKAANHEVSRVVGNTHDHVQAPSPHATQTLLRPSPPMPSRTSSPPVKPAPTGNTSNPSFLPAPGAAQQPGGVQQNANPHSPTRPVAIQRPPTHLVPNPLPPAPVRSTTRRLPSTHPSSMPPASRIPAVHHYPIQRRLTTALLVNNSASTEDAGPKERKVPNGAKQMSQVSSTARKVSAPSPSVANQQKANEQPLSGESRNKKSGTSSIELQLNSSGEQKVIKNARAVNRMPHSQQTSHESLPTQQQIPKQSNWPPSQLRQKQKWETTTRGNFEKASPEEPRQRSSTSLDAPGLTNKVLQQRRTVEVPETISQPPARNMFKTTVSPLKNHPFKKPTRSKRILKDDKYPKTAIFAAPHPLQLRGPVRALSAQRPPQRLPSPILLPGSRAQATLTQKPTTTSLPQNRRPLMSVQGIRLAEPLSKTSAEFKRRPPQQFNSKENTVQQRQTSASKESVLNTMLLGVFSRLGVQKFLMETKGGSLKGFARSEHTHFVPLESAETPNQRGPSSKLTSSSDNSLHHFVEDDLQVSVSEAQRTGKFQDATSPGEEQTVSPGDSLEL